MTKQEHRSEIAILGKILDTTKNGGKNGVLVSTISRHVNLSHNSTLKKCDKLINAGMLESIKEGRNRLYVILEKGIMFHNELVQFQSIMYNMNLRW